VVQEGDEAIDLLQVLFWGDMAQIWSEEDKGQSKLFKVLSTLGSSLELVDQHRRHRTTRITSPTMG
jgi:hypothetical protein